MLKRVVLVKNIQPDFVFEMAGARYQVQSVEAHFDIDCVTVGATLDHDLSGSLIFLDLAPFMLFDVHIPLS